MSKINVIDINDSLFEKRVLEIFSKVSIIKNERFVRLSDGWIKDLTTGLEWGKSSLKGINFNDAKEYCIKEGGRLPTRTELQTIQDLDKHNPCVDMSIFSDTKCDYYWTSTNYAGCSNAKWCVSFGLGDVCSSYVNCDNYVRPVRSSQ